MKRTFIASAAMVLAAGTLLAPGTAQAGEKTMRKANGDEVRISCRNSGCRISMFKNGRPAGTRTGPGGTSNLNKQVARFRSRGYR
jgi:hypothetical protein